MQGIDAVLDCCSQRDVVDDDASFLCSCIYNLQAETLSIEQIFVIELSFIFNSFVVGVRVVLNELWAYGYLPKVQLDHICMQVKNVCRDHQNWCLYIGFNG